MGAEATVWTLNKTWRYLKYTVVEFSGFILPSSPVPLFGLKVEIIAHPCFGWNAAEGNVMRRWRYNEMYETYFILICCPWVVDAFHVRVIVPSPPHSNRLLLLAAEYQSLHRIMVFVTRGFAGDVANFMQFP